MLYTYCQIYQEVEARQNNITWETFSMKNQKQHVAEKMFSRPSSKNQNWAFLWIDSLKCCEFIFILCPTWGPPKYIKTVYFILYKAFAKKKKMSGTSLPVLFSPWFLNKSITAFTFFSFLFNFIFCVPLLREILDNRLIAVVC